MNTINLLAELCRHGVTMVINDKELRLRAPRGVITTDLRASVAERKHELLEAFGDGVFPDPMLPSVITYPASLGTSEEAYRRCYAAQRRTRAA
jgi:hypothetical protein